MTDLTSTVRRTLGPDAALVPATEGTTLIPEQQVLFATAAAVAQPGAKVNRWATAVESVSSALSAMFSSRPPAQRYVASRYAYLEDAMMSREMDRL